MALSSIQIDHFNIPLPVVLSDSTHGDISHFALVTIRVTDEDGAEAIAPSRPGHGVSFDWDALEAHRVS